ncbi:hypothetical protein ACHAW5_006007 [Stephanodiscus triporus]|uniref:tRNA/rRNA methyltransferase SpoU type domain-containing protein n=1 Tax=Stephanodiscus triporus TaxID=2934178 RepID=A0ABD3MV59_9STRA
MRLSPRPSTRFVLVGTQHGENVGAAARAMKTMGFNDLALVSPRDPKVLQRQKVIQRASGATDVLRQTNIYASLEEALTDRNVVCGTGMPFDMHRKRRQVQYETLYVEPRVFFDRLILSKTNDQESDDQMIRLALIFGDERSGMSDSDIVQCDAMLGIPTNPIFGSLNLAAAVQVIAYDWRIAIGGHDSYDVD